MTKKQTRKTGWTKEIMESFIDTALEAEMEEDLGYPKY